MGKDIEITIDHLQEEIEEAIRELREVIDPVSSQDSVAAAKAMRALLHLLKSLVETGAMRTGGVPFGDAVTRISACIKGACGGAFDDGRIEEAIRNLAGKGMLGIGDGMVTANGAEMGALEAFLAAVEDADDVGTEVASGDALARIGWQLTMARTVWSMCVLPTISMGSGIVKWWRIEVTTLPPEAEGYTLFFETDDADRMSAVVSSLARPLAAQSRKLGNGPDDEG